MKNETPKTTILVALVVLLALANIVLVGLMLSNGRKGGSNRIERREEQMRQFLKKDLGFTADQMSSFEAIRTTHKKQMEQTFDQMRQSKKSNLQQLAKAGFSDSGINAIAAQACEQQQSIEQKMLQNLREIRNICSPEQRVKFDSGITQLFERNQKRKK